MLEAIDGGVAQTLQDAAAGASIQGDLLRTSQSISDAGAAITKSLDSALAAGDGQMVRVELTALYNFFHDLKNVYEKLDEAQKQFSQNSTGIVLHEVVDTVETAFGLGGPAIPGVQSAMKAAEQNLTSNSRGLGAAFTSLKSVVANNLQAVYDTYLAYLKADEDGAHALTASIRDGLNTEWRALDPTAPDVLPGKVMYA